MENENAVRILRVNTIPELDPYHADTGGQTYTAIKVNPALRWVVVEQEPEDGATPFEEWHMHILTYAPEMRPDEDALVAFLESEDGQRLLDIVCNEHDIIWNGNNMVGELTDEGEDAFNELCDRIDDLPESDWVLWDVEDWLNDSCVEEWMSDRAKSREDEITEGDINEVVERIEAEAEEQHVSLYGDVRRWVEIDLEETD